MNKNNVIETIIRQNMLCSVAVQECDCIEKVVMQRENAKLRVRIMHVKVADYNKSR